MVPGSCPYIAQKKSKNILPPLKIMSRILEVAVTVALGPAESEPTDQGRCYPNIHTVTHMHQMRLGEQDDKVIGVEMTV